MKRIIGLTFLILSLVLVMGLPAFADSNDSLIQSVIDDVNKANVKISEKIDHAKNDANKEIEKYNNKIQKDELSSDEISKLNEKLNSKIDKIIDKLIKDTDEISAKTIKKAARKGVQVNCELIKVEIGGREVLVDPLIVVAF
ncbi:coiled-coil domain-containing protein [Helicovermis profundi]|uniref:Uncharacterized protein n=1 Tax=Helicovermis profundi TaxID=3065157 RepID=A0AAU9E3C7_9FIRM|nr:hypothetical protein HLPR_07410 [Clostridia bacterium S502]